MVSNMLEHLKCKKTLLSVTKSSTLQFPTVMSTITLSMVRRDKVMMHIRCIELEINVSTSDVRNLVDGNYQNYIANKRNLQKCERKFHGVSEYRRIGREKNINN